MKSNPGDKVVNVTTPEPDPAATKKMFQRIAKRKVWSIFGPDKGSLIPARRRKRAK